MSYQTYFEIGGYVIESYVDGHEGLANRPPNNPLKDLAKRTGIPQPLVRSGNKQLKKDTGVDIVKVAHGLGRGKRASWALRTAAALALADGPLPIGDALAIGVLATYGTYEIYQMASETKEGLGF